MNNNQNEVHVNVQKAGKTGLFTNYIFKAIPLAFDESLSYYECLCGLLNYLKNTVIPVLNNNADAIVTLQNNINEFETNINQEMANFKQSTNESIAIFEQSVNQTVQQLQNYVNNYFANLDVQDEINNKLDQMVISGVLPEIIDAYLSIKSLLAFDTVASMKLSTNLINGSYAKTLGFYSKNDNGGALYKVRTKTNEDVADDMTIIQLLNPTLIAELVIENDVLNVKQLGAKGDGETDDTTKIQKALDINKNVFIPEGNYIISTLTINKYQHLYGIYTKSKFTSEESKSIIIPRSSDNCYLHDFSTVGGIELGVTGTADVQDMNCTLENIECLGGYGFHISQRGQSLINCKSGGTYYGFHIVGTDNIVTNCVSSTTDSHGFAITGPNNNVNCCKSFLAGRTQYGAGFLLTGAFCRIVGCEAQQNFYENYFVQNSFASNITGCLSDGAFWGKGDISSYDNPILGTVNTSAILLQNIRNGIVEISNTNGSMFSNTIASTHQVLCVPYLNSLQGDSITIGSYIRNNQSNIMTDFDPYALTSSNNITLNGINYNSYITKRLVDSMSHTFTANVVETDYRLDTIKIPTDSQAISLYFPNVSDKENLAELYYDIMIVYDNNGVTGYSNSSKQYINNGDNKYYNIKAQLDNLSYDSISEIAIRFITTNKADKPEFTFEINDLVISTSISSI